MSNKLTLLSERAESKRQPLIICVDWVQKSLTFLPKKKNLFIRFLCHRQFVDKSFRFLFNVQMNKCSFQRIKDSCRRVKGICAWYWAVSSSGSHQKTAICCFGREIVGATISHCSQLCHLKSDELYSRGILSFTGSTL